MGYLILFGGVWLAAMLGLKVGELVERLSGSTLAAALTSLVVYSSLLFAGCWLIMPPPKPLGLDPQTTALNARVHAQTVRGIINFGVLCFLVGGSLCTLIPIVRSRGRRR